MDNNKSKLFETTGYIVLVGTFIAYLSIFLYLSGEFGWSLFGATVSSLMTWGAYIVLRICFFASK